MSRAIIESVRPGEGLSQRQALPTPAGQAQNRRLRVPGTRGAGPRALLTLGKGSKLRLWKAGWTGMGSPGSHPTPWIALYC